MTPSAAPLLTIWLTIFSFSCPNLFIQTYILKQLSLGPMPLFLLAWLYSVFNILPLLDLETAHQAGNQQGQGSVRSGFWKWNLKNEGQVRHHSGEEAFSLLLDVKWWLNSCVRELTALLAWSHYVASVNTLQIGSKVTFWECMNGPLTNPLPVLTEGTHTTILSDHGK